MRKYPQPSDYQGVIQNPQHVFADPVLKACKVRKNPLGLPFVSSGGFALSFYLDATGGEQYVVRCFKADSPDRRTRYDAISRFLDANPAPFFLDVNFLERGILVNGDWFPVVTMPYVKGVTLHRYIEGEITAGRSLAGLSDKFRRVVDTLEKMGAAHGDLQHGNIMVQGGELVLIDYDGMYVPALKGKEGPESGQPSYQHPQRNDQFNPELDRFSTLVIDMALRALVLKPALWNKYSNGDNMLFRQGDFESPDKSPLLAELETLAGFGPQVKAFRTVCKGPLEAVPRLADFAAGRAQPAPATVTDWLPAMPRKRQAIYNAHDRDELLKHVGEQVIVVGRLAEAKEGASQYGRPYLFLNFGDYRASQLTLVIWSDALDLFRQQGKRAGDYIGQWVQVAGMLTSYNPGGRRGVQPQIEIEVPTQIEFVKGGEAAARLLLSPHAQVAPTPQAGQTPSTGTPAPVPPAAPTRPARDIDDQISRLYSAKPPAPTPVPAPQPPVLPPQPQPLPAGGPRPTLAALGIHVTTIGMSFGTVSLGQTVSRRMQVRNNGKTSAVLTVVDQPPFLTVQPKMLSCPAGGSIMFDVQLDTAAIPAGLLKRRMSAPGPQPESLLHDATLLVCCNGAEHLVEINCTIVHPASQTAQQAVQQTAQPKVQPSAYPSASPPAQPAPPAPGQIDRRWLRTARIVSAVAFVIVLLMAFPGVGSSFMRLAVGGLFPNAAAVQPPALPRKTPVALPTPTTEALTGPAAAMTKAAVALAASLEEEEAIASVCPTDLPVTLVKPKDFLLGDSVVFAWRAVGTLPDQCRFGVKLWREGRPRIGIGGEDVVFGPNGVYLLTESLAAILPRSQQSAGNFTWTVELTMDGAPGQALATAAEPLTFYWMPDNE